MVKNRFKLLLPILVVALVAAMGCDQSKLDMLKEKVKKNPNDAEAHNNLAYYFTEIGEYEKALEEYDKSLEIRPGDFLATMNKGKVLFDMQMYEDAIKVFMPLMDKYSDKSNLHSNIAMCNHYLKNYPEALKYYRQALELSDKNKPAKDGYALLLQDLKAEGINPEDLVEPDAPQAQPEPEQPEAE